MRTIFFILVSLLFVSAATAAQEAALHTQQDATFTPNAIACRNHVAAQTVATALQAQYVSAKELIVRNGLDGQCGVAFLPSDFSSPVAIANEGANIGSGQPAEDGRSTLIYEIPAGHERNHEDHSVFIMLLSKD